MSRRVGELEAKLEEERDMYKGRVGQVSYGNDGGKAHGEVE
jgi:hypothetical protein